MNQVWKKRAKSTRQIEDIVIDSEQREALIRAILFTGNERDRDYWLLFLDGISQKEIAERFGVSYKRMSVYAQSALERLECNLIKYNVI